MRIRQEEIKDHAQVYEMVKLAFAGAEHSEGNEQDLIVRLRKSEAFIPELSLVAIVDGMIVGHILFTEIHIGLRTELALAPLAVTPAYQKQGIGKALICAGHDIAKELGYEFSVVLGSDAYYPRFGYVPAKEFGIAAPFDVPSEYFMAFNLQGKQTVLQGTVAYDKAFFEDDLYTS